MPIDYENTEYRPRLAALCAKLGEDLKGARQDDDRVRALFVEAVQQYLVIARAAGAGAHEHAAELGCAETLREGNGAAIPSPFDLAGATDDEYERWSDFLADAADY